MEGEEGGRGTWSGQLKLRESWMERQLQLMQNRLDPEWGEEGKGDTDSGEERWGQKGFEAMVTLNVEAAVMGE